MDGLVRLRALEFQLPPWAAGLLLRVSGSRYDPYRQFHDRLQTIFVHIPKTAGSSITQALFNERPRHVPLSRFLARDAQRYARYFKFAFVRNPWDRLYSAWFYLAGGGKVRVGEDGRWAARHLRGLDSFDRFVAALDDPRRRRVVLSWVHFRPQSDWIRVRPPSRGGCDFIGRFESLDDDFAIVARRLGVECSLPVKRKREHAPYREVYSRVMAARVGEWYAEDVRLFGYQFD